MTMLFRRCSAGRLVAAVLLGASVGSARDIGALDILTSGYPRVFFFRAAEGAQSETRYPTYESWERQFGRLQGIMGKCLGEEVPGREVRNPEFFSRFKAEHPRQAVLLHVNGNSRDPRFRTGPYFAGHWIYRQATLITAAVPAEDGPTVIPVADAGDFRVQSGRYRTSNDDIALFGMTADGRHDWYHCEQVQLLDVDTAAKTIRVKRGCYGTRPLAFAAGAARAAAHAAEGPWGQASNLLWFYNFGTDAPRDRNGKSCADRLVDDLAGWFGPGGVLEAFDGVEFDVLFNVTRGDTDGDGVVDNGVSGGVNRYGIGVVEFVRALRQQLTDNFILQADGALGAGGGRSQRAWGLLNGIESEGWPNLNDWEFRDWSGGLNRHLFWRDNSRAPAFSYVNHKWVEAVPDKPGVERRPDVPYARHRLAFAAAQFTDAKLCYSFAPKDDPDGRFGIWDEFRGGTENRLGWLGLPEGPAGRLATRSPDLLQAQGAGPALAARLSGAVTATATADGVRLVAVDAAATHLRFRVRGVPAHGADLVLVVEMQGSPMDGYPREMARFAEVGVSGGLVDLMSGGPLETGMRLRGEPREQPLDSASGATLRIGPVTIAGTELPAFFVHPPWKGKTGYTFWTQDADVPADGVLCFAIGMGEKSPARSDGVRFEVHVAEPPTGATPEYSRIFAATSKAHEWQPQTVPLQAYAGKRLRFKFVADCGPADDATTDHASWGDVRIQRSGAAAERITRPEPTMTWVNDRRFQSVFYFRHVRSDEVDVSFVIEGREPVVLHRVAAYAHADVVYRVFEKGLVLANPAAGPWSFNLAELTPGRHYRRLQATANQDTATNDGQLAGPVVTLGERDGLFLLRTP